MKRKKDVTEKLKFNEREIKIAQILAEWGTKKDEMGVIDLSIAFGNECWEMGLEEMKKKLTYQQTERNENQNKGQRQPGKAKEDLQET